MDDTPKIKDDTLLPESRETICAVSTPLGQGGIGIVRMSGSDSVGILGRIFVSVDKKVGNGFQSHCIYYGHVVNPETNEPVDEVLATVMRAPKTYTREDVVEINCHGGPAVTRRVLETALVAGARLAGPGEFTRRAFMNGRIDLTQAEAVMDLIASGSELAARAAVAQLAGGLSEKVAVIREGAVTLLSLAELATDFSDEDVDYVGAGAFMEAGCGLLGEVRALLSTYDDGKVLREGFRVAIAGRPNVGKSSLLNRLSRSDRAIVTDIPGTTRDTLEELVSIAGVPVRLIDTAGMRRGGDEAELLGVRRAEAAVEEADLVLFVLDGSCALTDGDRELAGRLAGKDVLAIINKSDLPERLEADTAGFAKDALRVSAKTGEGVDELSLLVRERAFSGGRGSGPCEGQGGPPLLTINMRHKDALERAAAAFERYIGGLKAELSPELLALELKDALSAVGELAGETTPDEVLERIFSRFCIGK